MIIFTTALLIHYNIHTVFKLWSVIYSNDLKEVSSAQQACIYLHSKNTSLIQEGVYKILFY